MNQASRLKQYFQSQGTYSLQTRHKRTLRAKPHRAFCDAWSRFDGFRCVSKTILRFSPGSVQKCPITTEGAESRNYERDEIKICFVSGFLLRTIWPDDALVLGTMYYRYEARTTGIFARRDISFVYTQLPGCPTTSALGMKLSLWMVSRADSTGGKTSHCKAPNLACEGGAPPGD